MGRRLSLLLPVLAVLLGPVALDRLPAGVAQDAAGGARQATPAAGPVVVREVLGQGLPAAAPGQALALVHYTIPPATTLPPHVHPGVQVAHIVSGRLTYTVLTGEVPVARAVDGGQPGRSETIAAGEVTELGPEDAVVEHPGVAHFGRNDGAEPVVILASTLLAVDQPAAIVVDDTGIPLASPTSSRPTG